MSRPPITPIRWTPSVPEPAFPDRMIGLDVLDIVGRGPEDVLVDLDGTVLCGVEDGRILRLDPDGRAIRVVAHTAGRPLGLEWFADRTLLVCDARRGLLRVDPSNGTVTSLLYSIDGSPLRFCNNAAVTADGTVYFTDSSRHFGVEDWMADLLEHAGTGRLLRRSPDGQVDTLIDGLDFPNGVALTGDGRHVIVSDMSAYRLLRFDVATGQHDVLVDRLPGFVDNISTGTDGLIWLAMVSGRDPLLDRVSPMHPALRKLVWALPDALKPRPQKMAWIRAIDETDGRLVHDLRVTHPRMHMVTGVREHAGRVWLGSLIGDVVGVCDVPPPPSS